jgi:RNA exonuclease 4
MDLKNLSSNWKQLKQTLDQSNQASADAVTKNSSFKKRKREDTNANLSKASSDKCKRQYNRPMQVTSSIAARTVPNATSDYSNTTRPKVKVNAGWSTAWVNSTKSPGYTHNCSVEIGKYVAMDCEMVGVGPAPSRESALARVSIVNFDGDQIYDSYVKPLEPVTDWRTHVSGILPKHMLEARSLTEVQDDVCKILQGRVLVGHALSHDLDVLFLSHPRKDIRDTARHPAYRKLAGGSSPRLKILASELLGLDIQVGEHSSVEDARACMLLFRKDKDAFEREHAKQFPAPRPPPAAINEASNGTEAQYKKSKKKKKKKKKK